VVALFIFKSIPVKYAYDLVWGCIFSLAHFHVTFCIGPREPSYESSTDPRSPLRLAATCRLYNVPTKNVGLSNALTELTNPDSRKKKVYMNDNVRSAEVKNKEKALRMEEDERLRQEEIIAQAAE